jgi:hypothetical protein
MYPLMVAQPNANGRLRGVFLYWLSWIEVSVCIITGVLVVGRCPLAQLPLTNGR